MTELKVTREDVISAYKNTSEEGKKLLESLYGKEHFKLSITKRIKTFDDVLNELEINHDDFERGIIGLYPDEAAYRKIKFIVKVLNEGWKPNWKNIDEIKYYPYFRIDSANNCFSYCDYEDACLSSDVGSRLCFKSQELAEYAAKQFEDIYKDFFTK